MKQHLKILTWHVHGSYLYYLTQTPHTFYLPVKNQDEEGYGGRTPSFAWNENVIEIPAEEVKNEEFDLIVFQSKKNYLVDQYEILSDKQRQLPQLYLEHDPPREHPTDTHHVVRDKNVGIVHVTFFNELMWDNGESPTFVIPHGVTVPSTAAYTGEKKRGVVVINNLQLRGRRLGLDIFKKVREEIPLDLYGMGSQEVGGLGELPHEELLKKIGQYRFFFNPIRYTSLGLSVCEAMMIGLPMVGLSTTEMAVVVKNGYNGYRHTDVEWLIERMKLLLADENLAHRLSVGAQRTAQEYFALDRFVDDWDNLLRHFHTQKQPTFQLDRYQMRLFPKFKGVTV